MPAADCELDGEVAGAEVVPVSQMWFKELVDNGESDAMRIWTIFASTHPSWPVDDLTSVVAGLLAGEATFYGPVQRNDGVFSLFVEVPFSQYVQLDSRSYDAERGGVPPAPWSKLLASRNVLLAS